MPELELDSSQNDALPQAYPCGKAWFKAALFLLIALVLFFVFLLYLKPDFVIDTANQMWSCF